MALAAALIWEVRTGGTDDNGAGFKEGASGTDFSQQNAAQETYTTLACTAGTSTLTCSGPDTFHASIVGNVIKIRSGTNFTVGWYEVTARASSTSITIDRDPTTGSNASAGVGNMGGAALTIKAMTDLAVMGNIVYVKGDGTYSISVAITFNAGITYQDKAELTGYTTTRGDNGLVLVRTTAAVDAMQPEDGWVVKNFDLDGNGTGTKGIDVNAGFNTTLWNIRARNFTSHGFDLSSSSGGCVAKNCDAIANGGSGFFGSSAGTTVVGCTARFNTLRGFGSLVTNLHCIAFQNTDDGFRPQYDQQNIFMGNIGHANGSDGCQFSFNLTTAGYNNIFTDNGGYGVNCTQGIGAGSRKPYDQQVHHNAYRGNTSGARNPYNAGEGDVTLTADPFTNVDYGTDLVVDAVDNTKVASATHSFVAADVGEIIYIRKKTSWTEGEYTINSVTGGAAILSASPAAVGVTGGLWSIENFNLNATAGGGAACKEVGFPGKVGLV